MSNITNPEDLKLPAASVAKILKQVADGKNTFSSDFQTAVARASAVFVLNSIDSALEHANKEGRSTINAGDIVAAVGTLDHPEFQNQLLTTLNAYRSHKNISNKKIKK